MRERLTASLMKEKIIVIVRGVAAERLFPLPHLTAPAGIAALHRGMVQTEQRDLADIPFVFFRGVKTATDMMRGEETELFGLCAAPDAGSVYVLPGSPAKIVLGGRKQIKEAEAALLRRYAPCAVRCVSDEAAASATTAGMLRIYAHKDG